LTRKTPVQARSKATRDAIIEAAAQILSKGGLASYTTNAVAERAGVSIGSLYQYFPNKDALMAALINRHQMDRMARIAVASEEALTRPLPEAVRMLVRAAMTDHKDDQMLATAIDHEEARLPVKTMLADQLAQVTQGILPVLQSLIPDAPDEVVRRAAMTLPAMVRAIVDIWANQSPAQLIDAEEEAVRAVLGYLRLVQSAGG
jgi:AcrR family transcriptional regulator